MTRNAASSEAHNTTEARWAWEVLEQACKHAGYTPDARLIKFTNNAVFALRNHPVVVRIAGSDSVRDRAPTVVNIARWLSETTVPAVELMDGLPQPLHVHRTLVTFWHLVETPPAAPAPDGHDLGRILRQFHALTMPDFELPAWNPLRSIRKRISNQDILTTEDLSFVEQTCDQIEDALSSITYELPVGPIHGDPFAGNLIGSGSGAVLCDFDSAAFGPREWDLTPVAVGSIRFNYPTNYHQQLVSEYGFDITEWPYFPVLQKLRELQLVTSVLPTLRANPSLHDQWRHRFVSFRHGDRTAKWSTYR